jgi:hypothetical protein
MKSAFTFRYSANGLRGSIVANFAALALILLASGALPAFGTQPVVNSGTVNRASMGAGQGDLTP